MNAAVPIVSFNVGGKRLLGVRRGLEVYSSIHKLPIPDDEVYLNETGLQGDVQVDERIVRDKRVHGGPLKAVYVYPRAHYQLWANELSLALLPGMFGENVTVDEVAEDRVIIGEQWSWGEALLEVTSPRRPCYKLNMHLGDGTSEAMMANNRCGWYFKVLQPGLVPTTGEMHIVHRPPDGVTILEAFQDKVRRKPTVPDIPEE